MNFAASLYTRKPRRQACRRELTQQELFLYEALVGKPAEFADPVEETAMSLPEGFEPIKAVARRWKPSVTRFTVHLRTMYRQGVAAGAKHQQLADWLRHMSDHAFTRLDEAQARLNAARATPSNRRRVVAREVSPIRPQDLNPAMPAADPRNHPYNSAA